MMSISSNARTKIRLLRSKLYVNVGYLGRRTRHKGTREIVALDFKYMRSLAGVIHVQQCPATVIIAEKYFRNRQTFNSDIRKRLKLLAR